MRWFGKPRIYWFIIFLCRINFIILLWYIFKLIKNLNFINFELKTISKFYLKIDASLLSNQHDQQIKLNVLNKSSYVYIFY